MGLEEVVERMLAAAEERIARPIDPFGGRVIA